MDRATHRPPLAPAYATYALIALNVLLFAYQLSLGQAEPAFLQRWGLPAEGLPRYFAGGLLHPGLLVPIFTAMFLHANVIHLLANMLYLWVFGTRVEPLLGSGRFVLLYLVGGWVASLVRLGTASQGELVAVGASGAVAAVLGAYLALHPYAPLVVVAPRLFRSQPDVVALALLALWVLSQALGAVSLIASGTISMTDGAWWTHLGGFCVGVVLAAVLRAGGRRTPRPLRA
jgi:membrane associated rhomboid family serine protease